MPHHAQFVTHCYPDFSLQLAGYVTTFMPHVTPLSALRLAQGDVIYFHDAKSRTDARLVHAKGAEPMLFSTIAKGAKLPY